MPPNTEQWITLATVACWMLSCEDNVLKRAVPGVHGSEGGAPNLFPATPALPAVPASVVPVNRAQKYPQPNQKLRNFLLQLASLNPHPRRQPDQFAHVALLPSPTSPSISFAPGTPRPGRPSASRIQQPWATSTMKSSASRASSTASRTGCKLSKGASSAAPASRPQRRFACS